MALQMTAHDACSRKVHCVAKGYLDDPFVKFFAKDSTIVNSPLMNRGTWLRTKAIENVVLNFASACGGAPIQVISFGAGVDTLYFRLRKDHPDVAISRYLELDFPDLIQEKDHIIQKNTSLSSLRRAEYTLVPCDLREPERVAGLLKEHVVKGVPTILLAEMVFVYIEASITTELLRVTLNDVLGADTNVMMISYDAMQPNDRFGKMMVDNIGSFGAHLRGIADLPTAEAHEQRSKDVGFTSVQAASMRKLYLYVPRDTQIWLNKLEMIDDWDEWNLVHDHYVFVVASTQHAELPKVAH